MEADRTTLLGNWRVGYWGAESSPTAAAAAAAAAAAVAVQAVWSDSLRVDCWAEASRITATISQDNPETRDIRRLVEAV